jgi:hypothetical protein
LQEAVNGSAGARLCSIELAAFVIGANGGYVWSSNGVVESRLLRPAKWGKAPLYFSSHLALSAAVVFGVVVGLGIKHVGLLGSLCGLIRRRSEP